MKTKLIKDHGLVLLYDYYFQENHGEFMICWQGPHKVVKVYDNGHFDL